MALNLKTEEGVEIFIKLASQADVIVENFRTGAMNRRGLGYDDIRKINSGIIYCSVTGFGHTGPKSEHAAFDNTIQAFSGMMQQNGPADDDAVLVGPPVVDYGAGLLAAFAISSALFRRERTGKGQYLDVAMLDAALMLMTSSVLKRQHDRAGARPITLCAHALRSLWRLSHVGRGDTDDWCGDSTAL